MSHALFRIFPPKLFNKIQAPIVHKAFHVDLYRLHKTFDKQLHAHLHKILLTNRNPNDTHTHSIAENKKDYYEKPAYKFKILEIGGGTAAYFQNSTFFKTSIINDNIDHKVIFTDIDQSALKVGETVLFGLQLPKNKFEYHITECNVMNSNDIINVKNKYNIDSFDAISCQAVFHCIPGKLKDKLPIILKNLQPVMNDNTLFFGGSINCYPIQPPTLVGKILRKKLAKRDAMVREAFENDTKQDLEKILNENFNHVETNHQIDPDSVFSVFHCKKFKHV